MLRRPVARSVAMILLAGTMAAGSPWVADTDAALPLAGIVVAVDPGHNGGNASHPDEISRLVWAGSGWKPCNTGTPGG